MKVSRERINAAASATFRHTAEALKSGCDSVACMTLCNRLAGLLDAELAAAKEAGAPVACAAGCAFCCHQRVGVFPHEVVALWSHLRTRSSPADAALIERRILENAQRIDAMTVEQHRAANIPCAFLIGARCSAYDVRPSACAHHHSLSRERCEYAFDHPQDAGTPKNARPALLEIQAVGDALIEATHAGLQDAGLSSTRGELHQLLRTLLQDPRAVERWREGGELAAAPPAEAVTPGRVR